MSSEYKRCTGCWKEEPEVKLVEKTFTKNGKKTTEWFCSEGSCYGHYLMGLDG